MHPHVYFKEQIQSFNDFILWQTNNPYIYHTQSEFLFDRNGKQMVDFIGRFENLQEDFNKICRDLNIDQIQLPKTNTSQHDHYRLYYSDETRDIIAKSFKTDIENFKYEF